jgi:peroxiredoxin
VSFDGPAANESWKQSQSFEFELWSDDNKTLAGYYGAGTGTYANRVTKLLDDQGVLILEYNTVNPASHPADVLSDCEAIFGP